MSGRKRYALVYQAGIANLFQVDSFNAKDYGREAVRLAQGSFSECENVARGLRFAGARVAVFSCNRAGDIAHADWTTTEDDSPFTDGMRYARMIGSVL